MGQALEDWDLLASNFINGSALSVYRLSETAANILYLYFAAPLRCATEASRVLEADPFKFPGPVFLVI
jgi:hypothetical protein